MIIITAGCGKELEENINSSTSLDDSAREELLSPMQFTVSTKESIEQSTESTKESTEQSTESTKESIEHSTESTKDSIEGSAITVLTMYVPTGLDSLVGQTSLAFEKRVSELSHGTMEIRFVGPEEVGSSKMVLSSLLTADITGEHVVDLGTFSAYALGNYGSERNMLLALPYTFKNHEHFALVIRGEQCQQWLLDSLAAGYPIRGLYYGDEGFREIFSREYMTNMDRLSGMRIRIPDNLYLETWADALHMDPMEGSVEDALAGMERGTCELVELPLTYAMANDQNHQIRYCILDHHMIQATETVICEDVYQNLTEEERDIIQEASAYAQYFGIELAWDYDEARMMEELEQEGVVVTNPKGRYALIHSTYDPSYDEYMEALKLATTKEEQELLESQYELPSWYLTIRELVDEVSEDYQEEYQEILDLAPPDRTKGKYD
ncbi:MAG: TRAP transporter substrate-binding protein DctP [Lachnospiraceae bacterium]|nr:TRAP transporter substrate-binding protein DctP [Lachnospiraceae bacterium]